MIESVPPSAGASALLQEGARSAGLSGESLLLATLQAMGDGLLSCDRAGSIVLMNSKAEELTGWNTQEALGRPVGNVLRTLDEVTRHPVPSPLDAMLRGDAAGGGTRQTIAVRRDGGEFVLEGTVAPVQSQEGSLQGAVLVFRDVSTSRRAETILALLSEAGLELTEAPDQAAIMERVGALGTREFADIVSFDLLNEDGTLSRFASPPRDPSQKGILGEALHVPPSADTVRAAFRMGDGHSGSIFAAVIDDAWRQTFARGDAARIAMYRRIGLHSLICVPLIAGQQYFGLLTFSRTLLRTPFDKEDRIAAEDLGRRVGAALQRTRLIPALQAERARLKTIIDNAPVGIIVADKNGKLLMGNGAVENIMRHELLPTETIDEHEKWLSYHADGRRVEAREYPLARAILHGVSVPPEEYLYARGDGTRGWITLTASPIFDEKSEVAGGVVAILDIDAQKQAQEALRISEERSRQILTSTRDCIKVLDLQGNLLSMNEEGQQRLGIDDFNTVRGSCWLQFWGDGAPLAEKAMKAALDGGVGQFEGKFVTGKDETTWWDITITPMVNSSGEITQLLAVSRESTTRKQAESALRESEMRFRRLVEQSSVGVMIGSTGGALSYVNDSLLSLLGYTADEVSSGSLRRDQLTPEELAPLDQSAILQLEQNGICVPYEKAMRAKDGRLVPLLLGATSLGRAGTDLEVAVFLTDLTAQKKTEAALLESEKLAAVGKLASSISHEINNPLEAVTNLLFIVRNMAHLPEQVREYLGMADKELQRVSQIVAQTLRFHRQSTRPREIDPAVLVDQVLALYAARFTNYNIAAQRDYQPEARLTCYEGDVRQVLNNLVGNAIDAMRNGGEMRVRTRFATDWRSGKQGVRTTIADNGSGMTPEVRHRIFEAFFTTKDIHGTGLGLWISSQIVAKHGGRLCVRSTAEEQRHGSVFSLWLPLLPAAPTTTA